MIWQIAFKRYFNVTKSNLVHSATNTIYDQHQTTQKALAYIDRGFAVVPVRHRSKKPLNDWGSETLTGADLDRYFAQPANIGIALGARSGDLVDIDIDDDIAKELASQLLPETGMIFGRSSRRRTHWIYRAPLAKTQKFVDLDGTIIEVRGTGAQTVFPGSIHETGERIEFDCDGEPARVSAEELVRACKSICIGTTLLPRWGSGSRHSLALATAGLLAKSKWEEHAAAALICAIATTAIDDELEDRLHCVSGTYARFSEGEPIEGYERLVELLGQKAAGLLAKWAGLSLRPTPPSTPAATALSLLDLKSEARSADRFAVEHAGQLLFCEGRDTWLARDNKMWERVSLAHTQRYSKRFCVRQTEPFRMGLPPEAVSRLESKTRINNILELAREQLLVRDEELDCNGFRFGLKDGSVFDLPSGGLCDEPDSIVTMRMDAVYDGQADCPSWVAFLDRIFDGDKEVISFVQRAVGYSLTGDTSGQCMFVLVGSGSNGKSTFINTLADMMGEYAAATPMKTLMYRQHGNDQTDDLARLVRKRFVSASEGEDGQRLAQAKIKNMTGGEKLSCRALWQNLFEYRPEFKLWLATNSLPDINGADEAVRRRIHIVDFPVKIAGAERDLQLPQKLAEERSGILNWAIEGYRSWAREGLNAPERVHGSTAQYLQDNDPIEQFIEACCVRAPLTAAMSSDLYRRYVDWAAASAYEPMHANTFGKTLRKKGFERQNKRNGTAWKGLGLRPLGE